MFKGIEDELDESGEQYEFGNDHTNGMQFRPLVDNFNQELSHLHVYDSTNLLLRDYKDGNKVDEGPNGVRIFRYNASSPFDGTQDVLLAYNSLYKIYGANCYGCN